MIMLIPSKKFLKDVAVFKKPAVLRKKIVKTLALLKSDPRHPSLHLERIVNDETAWSIRVDKYYRISIEPIQQNTTLASKPLKASWEYGIFLLRILEHDDLYKSSH